MKKGILSGLVLLILVSVAMIGSAQAKPEAEAIVIGGPLSLAYQPGWAGQRALILAVEEINAAGGVNVAGEKRPFKLEIMDNRDLEPGVPVTDSVLVCEKLILEKGAKFFMAGPTRSEAAIAAMELMSKYKVISISASPLSPVMTKKVVDDYEKYKYYFRASTDAVFMTTNDFGGVMNILQKRYGHHKMYLMVQDVAHGRAAAAAFKGFAKKTGWEIIGEELYPTGASDFSAGLFKAKTFGAQFIGTQMDMPECSILAKQWYDMKVPAVLSGTSPFYEPGFWEASKGRCENILVCAMNAGNAPSEATPWTMKFYNAYTKRWGVEPEGHPCAPSYMAPYILKDAIERAGTLDPDTLVKALEKTDLMGVYGRIRFAKNHQVIHGNDPAEAAIGCFFQWKGGKRKVVWPTKVATTDIDLPPWMK